MEVGKLARFVRVHDYRDDGRVVWINLDRVVKMYRSTSVVGVPVTILELIDGDPFLVCDTVEAIISIPANDD